MIAVVEIQAMVVEVPHFCLYGSTPNNSVNGEALRLEISGRHLKEMTYWIQE